MWLFMISNSISFGLVILACLVFFTLIELWLYAVEKIIIPKKNQGKLLQTVIK